MDEEKLVEYLMEGVVILKNVRDANVKVNEQIDDFLKRLSDAATTKEDKPKEPKKAGEPQNQEATEDKMTKMLDMMEKIKQYQNPSPPGSSSAGKELTLKEALMKEAMEKAQEAAVLSPLTAIIGGGGLIGGSATLAQSTPKPSMGVASTSAGAVAIESSDVTVHGGGTLHPKVAKVIKLSKGKVTGSSAPSEGTHELPVVDDSSFTADKVWCAVCDEYHDPLARP